jgi:hypothetical protein
VTYTKALLSVGTTRSRTEKKTQFLQGHESLIQLIACSSPPEESSRLIKEALKAARQKHLL